MKGVSSPVPPSPHKSPSSQDEASSRGTHPSPPSEAPGYKPGVSPFRGQQPPPPSPPPPPSKPPPPPKELPASESARPSAYGQTLELHQPPSQGRFPARRSEITAASTNITTSKPIRTTSIATSDLGRVAAGYALRSG